MPGLIAIPCLETIATVAAMSIHRMLLRAPKGSKEYFNDDPFPLHLKRNKMAHKLIQSSNKDLDWILMVDSDMVPPENTICQLERGLTDYAIVGALCFTRRPPHHVCAGVVNANGQDRYLPLDQVGEGIVDVAWVGTGCVMIKSEVFVQMPVPWFVPKEDGRGEDMNFMKAAKNRGFKIGCALDVRVGHLNLINVDHEYAQWWTKGFPENDSDRRVKQSEARVEPIWPDCASGV